MKQQTWTTLLQTPLDADYVQHFQALAALNLEMRRRGPSAARLVRRAILEMEVGNYRAALEAAQDALDLAPDNLEALFQEAQARILLALVRADAIASGPGTPAPRETATELLESAVGALDAILEKNPDDDDVAAQAGAIRELLEMYPYERDLRAALRDHMLH